jgi:hypothetical protein
MGDDDNCLFLSYSQIRTFAHSHIRKLEIAAPQRFFLFQLTQIFVKRKQAWMFCFCGPAYLCCNFLIKKNLWNMKKIFTLLCIALAIVTQQASAQIKKGEKMLGGSIGFATSKAEQSNAPNYEASVTNVSISPQLGFGLGGNWIAGIQAGYGYSKQKTVFPLGGVSEDKSNTISGGVFARKFFPFGERFGLFGQGDVNYSHAKVTTAGVAGESNTNRIGVSVSPGAYFRTGKRFILEAEVGSLGYEHSVTKPEGGSSKTTSNSFFLGLSNNLSIGFKVVL